MVCEHSANELQLQSVRQFGVILGREKALSLFDALRVGRATTSSAEPLVSR
jgi:hypothetical protein